MKLRLLLIIATLLLFVSTASAQYIRVNGVAEKTGSALVSGISSSNKPSITFPGATITVFSPTGSGQLATIYSSATGTAKGNPYTASLTDATYDFFIAPGSTFDVRVSGISGGVAITPFTRSGYVAQGTNAVPSLIDFGGNADGVTSNNTAITRAEASPTDRIYISEGTYATTLAATALAEKAWYGPGRFLDSGTYAPGMFRYWLATPSPHTGIDNFSGDQSLTEQEQWILGPNVRSATSAIDPLTQQYFESTTTPHWALYTNYGGASGTNALLTVGAVGAVTTVTANSVANLTAGQHIKLTAFDGLSSSAVLLITNVNTGTKVVTFTPALSVSDNFPINSSISTANRTMNQFMFIDHNHNGEGDSYAITIRSTMSGVAEAGQIHPFYTATGGMIGGDAHVAATRLYWTTIEHQVYDDGNDIQAIGYVQTFSRTNATKAWEWGGIFFNGAGTQATDFGVSLGNLFTVGLDTVTASTTIKPLNMRALQRIVFNSTADATKLYTNWGSLIGNTSMGQEADPTGDWTIIHKGAEIFRSAGTAGSGLLAGTITMPFGVVVGSGTGAPNFWLNGGTGTAQGPAMQFRSGGGSLNAVIGAEAVYGASGTSQALVLATFNSLDIKVNPASGIFRPYADNVTALGSASFRFTGIYGTSINSSAYNVGSTLLISSTAPTVTGFGTSPSVVANNGTAAFTINVGTGGSASTGTITFPTASTGWVVTCYDVTTPASFVTSQTGGSTTTATVTNYSRTTGLAIAWTASDILRCQASAY